MMQESLQFETSLQSNAYFNSLPAYVQETIKQSGIKICSEEELRQCAQNLMSSK